MKLPGYLHIVTWDKQQNHHQTLKAPSNYSLHLLQSAAVLEPGGPHHILI